MANSLVYDVRLLVLLRLILNSQGLCRDLHSIWDHNISNLDIGMRIEGIFSPLDRYSLCWFDITHFHKIVFVRILNSTLNILIYGFIRFFKF